MGQTNGANGSSAPIRTAILCLDNTLASTVFGPLDILGQAGQLWNALCRRNPQPVFDVRLVSLDGQPVQCLNGPAINVSAALDEQDWQLVLLSAAHIGPQDHDHSLLSAALRRQHQHGAVLASICTGAFALAEAGLLDGREATTHWGFVELFRRRYPQVLLQPEQLVTHSEQLFCSGGFHAYQDLCLRLIEHFCDFECAEQTARALVMQGERPSQLPYRRFDLHKQHQDAVIRKVQEHIEAHYAEALDNAELAALAHLGERQFKRRFQAAGGESALQYLQRVRVEMAKQQLRSSREPVERIADQVGYSDAAFFRQVFRRHTGLIPLDYRRKMQRRA
ncbi:hypothetical protein A9179_14240 [Pseudomonas alcaligenes]|uniref:HTH araC/xylS-type domain-containing protein n=1 Tax=Aquipseudomonas alcaligenes TaxID=43263 RepID=A0ABR7S1I0_AQUAC|nr:helix-turn-helix domain-containing protein [Pseudomonas alcaligenes]MBC9251427.1 hypothetical protein [Pseudomonas alcaligenes]